MAQEIDDDVPIYFSPGDDDVSEDVVVEVDRKALLEDEPPRQWEPYMPAKTLEEAAVEAEKRGESKIKGLSNRKTQPAEKIEEKKKKEDSTDQSSVMPSLTEARQEQSMTLERFLKLSGKFLKPNLIVPVEQTEAEERERREEPRAEPMRVRKQVRVLLVIACVNVFAIGFWCGSFVFPNNKVVTGLRFDEPKEGITTGPRLHGDTSISDVVSRINPVVVNIDTRIRRPPQPSYQPYRSTQNFFQPPSYTNSVPRSYPGQAQASGLIVSNDGYILTNNHVVAPGTEIRVTMNDHREYQARVIGRDAYSDLAVIKINATNLPVARFADASKIRVGDWAIVVGSPHGFDHTVTIGVVSALGRVVPDFNHHIPLIQTDASIAPGNSGGPLVNIDGEVMGIASAAANRGAVGINFALPADTVSQVTKKLIEEGSIPRPFLGIFMEDIDPDKKKAQTLPSNPVMVVVGNLVGGGPAEKVGILRGDIILRVNGKAVKSSSEVRAILATLKPGDEMNFDIRRLSPSCELTKKVILEKYPDSY